MTHSHAHIQNNPEKDNLENTQKNTSQTKRNLSTSNAFQLDDHSGRLGFKLWTLTFNLPGEKVNKLDIELAEQFDSVIERLEELARGGKVDAVVFRSGKKDNFLAGFDVKVLRTIKTAQEAEGFADRGHEILDRWEDLPFPTIAAVDGACMGGGCEIALACTAIVISENNKARIGLPETLLGIIPGMGGCIRMSQKVGLATSLDMILTGKTLTGKRALKAGLVEACLPAERFDSSIETWVKANLKKLKSGERLAREPKLGGMGGTAGRFLEKTPMGRSIIFKKAREGVLKKTRGKYPAPLEAIDVIRSSGATYGARLTGNSRSKAMKREAQGFGRVVATDVSRNLVRLFFMTEAVKKSNGLPENREVSIHPVEKTGVLGAGTMGGGIAQLFADKNISTRMKDLNKKALEAGMAAATSIFKKKVKRRRISKREFLQKLNQISPTLEYSGFENLDVIVEAVVENKEIKNAVFKELESIVSEECIIASNTSTLPISEMQKTFKHPERFVGMHYFNPVHRMPLIEIIRGEQTSDEAIATIYALSKRMGKTPIVVNDCPGFLVNRILCPYLNEASWLVAEGVPIDELDEALLDFGMPMGPMELIDEVGVDVGEKAVGVLESKFGERMKAAPLSKKIVGAGRLGKKNKKGLYDYSQGIYKKELNPEIYEVIGVKPEKGVLSNQELVERCVLPMINEASRCLDENIVSSASELDLGMIMGTGFPPFRGGLLQYADTLGASRIVERLNKYYSKLGPRYEPSRALVSLAEKEQRFYKDVSE